MARKTVTFSSTGLFSTSTVSDFTAPSAAVSLDGLNELSGSVTTGSWDISSPGSGLESTQQIPLDWSKFERHTFFDSAESKVNVAFDTIINFFPFDESDADITQYLQDLTGYERYVFDSLWPKYKGYLHFSGTVKNEDPASGFAAGLGTYISAVDQAGHLYPTISRRRDAQPIINFNSSPFTCAFHINVPARENSNSVIVQKLLDRDGFSIFLSASSASSEFADVVFMLSSGSMAMSASAKFEKSDSKFQHCTAMMTRDMNENPKLLLYKDGTLAATSSQTISVGPLNFAAANLLIGSGTNHYLGTYSKTFEAETTLSGTLDDFRFYSKKKNVTQIKQIISGTSGHSSDMLLYYKFNEPTGSYSNNSVVLDSSGNSLHAKVTNFTSSLREKTFGGRKQ